MANKRKGKTNLIPIVGGIGTITLASLLVLLLLARQEPLSIQEVIDQKLAEQSALSERRKDQLRIQLSINDFMDRQNGRVPQSLTELVPKYFKTIPVDPVTNKPFSYEVSDGRPLVGKEGDTKNATIVSVHKTDVVTSLTPDQTDELLQSLEGAATEVAFLYDPSGKRDPFRPFDLSPAQSDDEGKTPLERFSLGQLRLTAVLDGFETPRALVETATGKGFTVEKGTKIGQNNGEIVEILPNKILILEETVDYTGKKHSKTIEMTLRTKDQENQ